MIRALTILAFTVTAAKANQTSIQVESVSLRSVHRDRLELSLSAALRTTQSVTVRGITFYGFRLNGVPIYLSPVRESFKVDPARGPHSLRLESLTVYYRDLDSLTPIRRMIEKGVAELQGRARIDVELPILPRVLPFTPAVQVVAPLTGNVPIHLPGGRYGKQAALLSLSAADSAMGLGRGAMGLMRRRFGWVDEFATGKVSPVLLVQTTYGLTGAGGKTLRKVTGVGFLIAPKRFSVSAEMLEPWSYDPEVVHLIENQKARLDEAQYDVEVWMSNAEITPNSGASLRNKKLRVVKSATESEKVYVLSRGAVRRIQLRKRNSERNAALLEFVTGATPVTLVPDVSSSVEPGARWERLAMFRFQEGTRSKVAKPEVIYLAGQRKGNRIILAGSVDSTVFGSPIMSEDGIIGMIQDEVSGTLLHKLLAKIE